MDTVIDPPYDIQLERFRIEHPELITYIAEMVGIHATCQAEEIGGRHVTLDEAYDHIYIKNCPRCKRNMELEKTAKDRFLRR